MKNDYDVKKNIPALSISEMVKSTVLKAVNKYTGTSRQASALGISKNRLYYLMHKYNIVYDEASGQYLQLNRINRYKNSVY